MALLAVPAAGPRLVDRQQVVAPQEAAGRIVTIVRAVPPVPLATVGALPAVLVAMMATTALLAVLARPEQVGHRVRPAPVARRVAIDSMLEVLRTVQPGPTVAHARTVPAARSAVQHHAETASTAASVANDLPVPTGRIAHPVASAPVATDRNARAAIVRRGIGTNATIGRHVAAAASAPTAVTVASVVSAVSVATGRHAAAAGPVVVRPVVRRAPVRVVGLVVRCDRAVMPRGRPVPDVS